MVFKNISRYPLILRKNELENTQASQEYTVRLAIIFKIILITVFCFYPNLNGQILKTVNLSFTQITQNSQKSDVVNGHIYYDGMKTTVKVNQPISQWLILTGNTIVLYYPEDHRVLEIQSQSPVSLPFFQAFTSIVKLDYGLTELGFNLAKNEIKGDTLLAYWQPPVDARKVLGYFVLALEKNKILFSEFTTAKGEKIAKTIYSNHFMYSGSYFPLEIVTIQYAKKDSTVEKILYTDPVFNAPLPAEIAIFTIPPSIKREVIKW